MKQLPSQEWNHRDIDEEALAHGLARGDAAAVSSFLERTHRPVYAMALRLTTDPDLRHDWTHEILLKILDELGRGRFVYRHPGCFWAWFRTRCHFLLINLYHRHRQQQDRWTAGEIGQELIEKLPLASGADPLRLVEAVEARAVIENCLDSLASEDQRRALYLALCEDQPYQTIADEMGAVLNTVRSWIRRARVAIRRCVLSHYGARMDAES